MFHVEKGFIEVEKPGSSLFMIFWLKTKHDVFFLLHIA